MRESIRIKSVKALAKAVADRWDSFVAGEYVCPPCPTPQTLESLLEIINYAAAFPEEGRYPRFNVTATSSEREIASVWRFDQARPFSVAELRRLIPATDVRKSAVSVEWCSDGLLRIVGVQDIGTTWHRARSGLGYQYEVPSTLWVEVERPNRFNIYQDQFRLASFSDGVIELGILNDMPLFFILQRTMG